MYSSFTTKSGKPISHEPLNSQKEQCEKHKTEPRNRISEAQHVPIGNGSSWSFSSRPLINESKPVKNTVMVTRHTEGTGTKRPLEEGKEDKPVNRHTGQKDSAYSNSGSSRKKRKFDWKYVGNN